MRSRRRGQRHIRLLVMMVALVVAAVAFVLPARAAPLAPAITLTPTVNGTVAGWLTDFADERNYMLNTYLQQLDYLAEDPNYTLAVTDAPVMIALLELRPDRADEIRRYAREGRLEFANAFWLSGALGLTGGEALMRLGIYGIEWADEMFGSRPRVLWLVDSTGVPNQMPQLAAQLGVRGVVFSRNNPTPTNTFAWHGPDGSSVPATSGEVYTYLGELFRLTRRLNGQDLQTARAEIAAHRREETPGVPSLLPVAAGDYSLPPQESRQTTRLEERWAEASSEQPLQFGTPGAYFENLSQSGVTLPIHTGEVPYGFGAFWVNAPRAKQTFRLTEHRLAAAEAIGSVASVAASTAYPSERLTHGWLALLINMDRSPLWGVGAGVVFEHPSVWDVADRFALALDVANQTISEALGSLVAVAPTGDETHVTLVNPLNWQRQDVVEIQTPGGRGLSEASCEALEQPDRVLCGTTLPAFGARTFTLTGRPQEPTPIQEFDGIIETPFYHLSLDTVTGDLISLKRRADGRELIAGPANAIIAQTQSEPSADVLLPHTGRTLAGSTSDVTNRLTAAEGQISWTVVAEQRLPAGGMVRRVVRLYRTSARIDFQTTLTDIPDGHLISASFPLAEDIVTHPHGTPYGFVDSSNGGAIAPSVRWSAYGLLSGGTVAILDRGVPAREVVGATIVVPLLNANDRYRGFPNSWLSGAGSHQFEYSLMVSDSDWRTADIPRRAWEMNAPPLQQPGAMPDQQSVSWIRTSDNLIVESVRRVGGELEIRAVDWTGHGGDAQVEVLLPHRSARLVSPFGETRRHFAEVTDGVYKLSLQPQEIVTVRVATDAPTAPTAPALRTLAPLVPPAKQASLSYRHDRVGHPPETPDESP